MRYLNLTLCTDYCFRFFSSLNKKWVLDLVNVILKVTNISPPEAIADAIEQTLRVTKALTFDSFSSIRVNFYHDFAEVPQNNKT